MAAALLESLCRLFLAEPKALLRLAHHFWLGSALVIAGFSGLPRPACAQVEPSADPFSEECSACGSGSVCADSGRFPGVWLLTLRHMMSNARCK